MKIVLDTNVSVSGLMWTGNESEILDLCVVGRLRNFASPEMLVELDRVLRYDKFKLTEHEIEELLRVYLAFTTIVRPTCKIGIIEKDPSDNVILECAVGADVDFIISGDIHLLELEEFDGIKVLRTVEFLDALRI